MVALGRPINVVELEDKRIGFGAVHTWMTS